MEKELRIFIEHVKNLLGILPLNKYSPEVYSEGNNILIILGNITLVNPYKNPKLMKLYPITVLQAQRRIRIPRLRETHDKGPIILLNKLTPLPQFPFWEDSVLVQHKQNKHYERYVGPFIYASDYGRDNIEELWITK